MHPLGGQASTAQDQLIGHQGLVIHTLAIPQAEFAFELGIREIGIAGDLGRIHQLGIHHHHPEPAGQAIPAALGIPQIQGHIAQQLERAGALEQTQISGPIQACRIHQHQHIRGRLVSFAAQALNQGIIFCLQQLHLDAGFSGELLVELLIAVVMPA